MTAGKPRSNAPHGFQQQQLDLLEGDQAEALMVLERQHRALQAVDVQSPGWVRVPELMQRLQVRIDALRLTA